VFATLKDYGVPVLPLAVLMLISGFSCLSRVVSCF
jgi:hypothetical protein